MPEALITPDVLKWARKRAHFTPDGAAQKVQVRPERFIAWEEGNMYPTFRQAKKLAKAFHVPFGYFFLPAPPKEKIDIPDLRTVGGRVRPDFSLEFIDLYHGILRKQEWFREHRLQEGIRPLSFIGKFSVDSGFKEVAEDIRQELTIDDQLRASSRNWEQFIAKLVEQVEKAGILVFRNSIVGNNTHRPISVDEFRGLAISDPIAPLIFINSRDAKSAQIFTLAHELAHLWLGASGVSNPILKTKKNENHDQRIESFCNKTAAELLVPEAEFLVDWDQELSPPDNITLLSKKYRVSTLVIARRGYDFNLLSYDEFQEFYLDALQYDRRVKARLSKSDGGPGSFTMQKMRNGTLFSRAVTTAAFEGRLPLRDGAALLGIKPAKLKKYADFLAGK